MKANIGTASKHFGVSQETLRRWEKSGKILVERTAAPAKKDFLAS